MNKAPRISVLIPAYNSESLLRSCLDSLITQSMPDFEAICLNDGSTDGTLDIFKSYAKMDERFRVINKPNSGYGDTMNRGLEEATGEFIAILESDDTILPTMYEKCYAAATENKLDYIKADFEGICGKGDSLEKEYMRVCSDAALYSRVFSPRNRYDVFDADLCTWTGIYRRSFIEKNHIRYNTTPGAAYQDNGFWFQTTCFAERVMFLPEPFYQYRKDNPNSSINSKTKVFCMCDEHAFMHSFLDKHPEFPLRFYELLAKKMYHNYLFTYQRIADAYKEQFLQRWSKDFSNNFIRGEVEKNDYSATEWETICDIVDDYKMAYRKIENVLFDEGDKIIQNYRLRIKQAEIEDLKKQLKDFQTSPFFKVPSMLKHTSDYVSKYGFSQLAKRALFKTPAIPTKQEIDRNAPLLDKEAATLYGALPEPCLLYADAFQSLDSVDSVLSWRRRRTGKEFTKDNMTASDKLLSSLKTASENPSKGTLTGLWNYAVSKGIEIAPLRGSSVVLENVDAFENYLFGKGAISFYLRINADVPWGTIVLDATKKDMSRIRDYYHELSNGNLSFVAGQNIQNADGPEKLILTCLPPSQLDERSTCSIICAQGTALAAIVRSKGKKHFFTIGCKTPQIDQLKSRIILPLVPIAENLANEQKLATIEFDIFKTTVLLKGMSLGIEQGGIRFKNDALDNILKEKLNL